MINKTPISLIKSRDSVEKRFKFTHNGATYIYCSSVPDDIVPASKDMERFTIIFTICKYTLEKT